MINALIVDDDIATVDVIKEKVNWDGLGIGDVYIAYNIHQAKDILLKNDISIIISDIEMPQGTGIDLLDWFREEKLEGEFLLLTCHESFDYATHALKQNASEYLLKPFDVIVMEAALRKIVFKINEDRKTKETLSYGKWAEDNTNRRSMQLSFLRMLLEGRTSVASNLMPEILPPGGKYRLVISKITDVEHAIERMSSNLFGFVLENIHSELLTGNPENYRVVITENRDNYVLATVCDYEDDETIEKKVKELIYQLEQVIKAPVSCCISNETGLSDISDRYDKCTKLLINNVAYYRTSFFENQLSDSNPSATAVLDVQQLLTFLEKNDKASYLGYLKKVLNDRMFDHTLNDAMLSGFSHEIWQSIYMFLAKSGVAAEGFFVDDAANQLTQKAHQSVMDMLRWASYLLEQLFVFVEKSANTQSPVEKIKSFIAAHYMENISRVEIGEELGLNPEYVSKLFKKETGENLTDYLAAYRVEQAKSLLDRGMLSVSEVAEACGFENSTYFSTIFKKHTGVTPNQYKKG